MSAQAQVKSAPHSKETEMTVLGCMINSPDSLKIGSQELNNSHFYFSEHEIIFQVLRNLHKQGKPADIQLIYQELINQDKSIKVGGLSYLTTLSQYSGTLDNIDEYIEIVKNKSMLRDMINDSREMEKRALNNNENAVSLLGDFQNRLKHIENHNVKDKSEVSQIGEIVKGSKSQIDNRPFIEKIRERYDYYTEHGKPFLKGIPTGFIDLDQKVVILEDTNLIIVAARPAMGKTALALNISAYACFEKKIPTGIISLEMGRDQLLERLISMQTGISGEKIKRGLLTTDELKKISEESERVSDNPLYIIDRGCSTIAQVVSISRKIKESKNIGLLVVDYLQLIGTNGSSDSRQYEVAEISRSLKLLAMELKIPVLCIAQLSRKVEERTDKKPLLSDLRDSGQIEQDADAILFIYRRSYYDKNDKPNEADLILKKNRHGSEAEVPLFFDKDCGKFSNLSRLPNQPSNQVPSKQYLKDKKYDENGNEIICKL